MSEPTLPWRAVIHFGVGTSSSVACGLIAREVEMLRLVAQRLSAGQVAHHGLFACTLLLCVPGLVNESQEGSTYTNLLPLIGHVSPSPADGKSALQSEQLLN